MASPEKVAELFNLPFFKEMIPQTIGPFLDGFAELAKDNEGAEEVIAASREAHERTLLIGIEFMKGFYEEALTDEEVDVFIAIYSNPAYVQLMQLMPQIINRMFSWIEENQEKMLRAIDEVTNGRE